MFIKVMIFHLKEDMYINICIDREDLKFYT